MCEIGNARAHRPQNDQSPSLAESDALLCRHPGPSREGGRGGGHR
jgi:hypothetical protein